MPHTLSDPPRPAPRKRFGPKRSGPNKDLAPVAMGQSINNFCTYQPSVSGLYIGLEFEAESTGNHWGTTTALDETYWRCENDGSLRDLGREFVLRDPLPLRETLEAIGDLHTYVEALHAPLRDDSTRTSTHVHLNVQDWSPLAITNLACLWYVVEEAYSLTLPESRRGNLFALRACDTQRGPEEDLRTALKNPHNFVYSFSDGRRYGALNLAAVSKFGTVEFRLLPGLTNPLDVLPHLMAYIELWEASKTFTDPQEIIDTFSGLGPEGFVNRYMPKMWALMEGVEENARYRALYRGMRYAQDIASIRKNWKVETDDTQEQTTPSESTVQPTEPERFVDWTGTRYTPPQLHEDLFHYLDRRARELGYEFYDDLPEGMQSRFCTEWDASRRRLRRQAEDVSSPTSLGNLGSYYTATTTDTPVDHLSRGSTTAWGDFLDYVPSPIEE